MEEIEKLRSDLDDIDMEILQLLMRRTEIVKEIGLIKKQYDIPVVDKRREKKVCNNAKEFALEHDLDSDQIESIFKEIIQFSKKVQSEILEK
jgi:chorismate mutase